MAGFDHIASVYSILSRAVFGTKPMNAQCYFLSQIPETARVLVAGGGNGEILPKLNELGKDLVIDYVDLSAKMIAIATKQMSDNLDIRFIQEDIFICELQTYDVILTPFLLDCFSQGQLEKLMPRLKNSLKQTGMWIFTDFMPLQHGIYPILTWSMYSFFQLVTNLEADKLPDYDRNFRSSGLIMTDRYSIMNGYIESRFYRLA